MKTRNLRILAATVFRIALVTSLPGSLVHAREHVTDFSAGPPSGEYSFASWTPKSLAELLKGDSTGEGAKVIGHLFLPPGTEKVPAVLLVHGSSGIQNELLDFWPRRLNAEGIAVLSMDSFALRGVLSTAEFQSRVPIAADVADAFAALKVLATHPRVDRGRIAVMGFSRGGIAAWRSGVERLIAAEKLPDGLRFAAHVLVYSGGCVGPTRLAVKPGVFSKAPMLWAHGDKDDYTALAPCQDYAERIGKAGTPVEFVVIEGARHRFDSDDPRRQEWSRAERVAADCPLELDINTLVAYDRFTGQRLSREAYETTLKKSCSALGGTAEGDRGARDKAAEAVTAFFRKVFSRPLAETNKP